jgi:hypothetical protein
MTYFNIIFGGFTLVGKMINKNRNSLLLIFQAIRMDVAV